VTDPAPLSDLAARATAFARTPPRDKAALLRASIPRVLALAPEMVSLACRAAGVRAEGGLAGAAWLAGPVPLIAALRGYAEALDDIAGIGRPSLPAEHLRGHMGGRLVARLEPRTFSERSLHGEATAFLVFAEGVEPEDVIGGQAAFYRQIEPPQGGVALVLCEGGPPVAGLLGALHALFVEGRVVLLSTGAARVWLGPLVERGLGPLVEAGFLRVVEDAGALPDPGDLGEPLRAGPGGGPVVVVPALYGRDELRFITRRLASEVAAGAAFSIAAPGSILVAAHWAQRGLFVDLLERELAAAPGAQGMAEGLVAGVEAGDDPLEMLSVAVGLCNERGVGAPAEIVVHPVYEEEAEVAEALGRAVAGLRAVAVGVNQWPVLLGLRGDAPWGSWPGARMAARVDKAVVRGPLRGSRRPAYFHDNPKGARRGERLAAFEAAPGIGARLIL
jgi:hypothetical protein